MPQISGPTALGTRILSPGIGSRYPPAFSLPEASHRRPLRGAADEDVYHTPTVPVTINNTKTTSITTTTTTTNIAPPGRFLTVTIAPPPAAHLRVPSPLPSPHGSPHSATEDFIPILHQPVPKLGKAPAKTPMLVIVPPPSPSDDGFTPVTPSPSPRLKGFRRIRASQLPRDALGIATAAFTRTKSQRAVDEYDDMEPLSPPYDARAVDGQAAAKAKPARRTLFGVLEGWWDLGLLERGKSLRRKG